jgi:hypothetical protein
MLEPQNRRLLLEALRPPDGYSLDAALGTTYTLDLVALLTAPLSFALLDWQDDDGRPLKDPLALVEAVRRHADRISLFCQAGEIKVPTGEKQLLAYLEESVVEVASPQKGHLFHPKLWVLRYAGREDPVRYRVVCLSRNLTFDRAWDTTVVLDGELTERQRGFATNNPLADFVKKLPALATRPVPDRVAAQVDQIQRELRVVRFELPEPFDEVEFWPLGVPGARSPFDYPVDRLLVISPFVSDKALQRMTDGGEGHILVTRPESLARLKKKTLDRFQRTCILGDAVEGEANADEDPDGTMNNELRGLHAKVYVIDNGWDAAILTGSANATDAAFGGNVELLVELRGKKSHCGVDAVLSTEKGQATLASLLQDASAPDETPEPDLTEELLKRRLDGAQQAIIDARPKLVIAPAKEDGLFAATLEFEKQRNTPSHTQLRTWPITLHPDAAKPVEVKNARVDLGRLSFEALTSFVAFEIEAAEEGQKATRRFVLNLPTERMPAGRREKILRWLLKDPAQVLRLLLLLLADSPEEGIEALLQGRRDKEGGTGLAAWGERQIFESLMRALDRGPERLDQVASLVADLEADPETKSLLPPGFHEIWAPIWEARLSLGQDGAGPSEERK